MPYFLIKQLPSCLVERKLLLELEGYVQRKSRELVPPDGEFHNLKHEFTIQDSAGIETLAGVGDFQRSYFPDDTRRLKIEHLAVGSGKSLSVEIRFTRYKDSSEVTIRFDGNSAREVVIGIAAEIISILESYKTSNQWFHSWRGVTLLILGNTILHGSAAALFGPPTSIVFGAVYLLASAALGVLIGVFVWDFKPYSTFETRRDERRKKQFSWVVLGLLGFILFTVIGVYFRGKLLGF